MSWCNLEFLFHSHGDKEYWIELMKTHTLPCSLEKLW